MYRFDIYYITDNLFVLINYWRRYAISILPPPAAAANYDGLQTLEHNKIHQQLLQSSCNVSRRTIQRYKYSQSTTSKVLSWMIPRAA